MLGRIAIVALIVLLEVLLSAPVNSIAGVIGGVLLLAHFLYRRFLR
jgi:hypothetical protein